MSKTKHILFFTEWNLNDYWYCGDTSKLGHGSNYWWHPARMMGLKPVDYTKMVIEKFNPDAVVHSSDGAYVGFRWKKQTDMRKFKNFINKKARETGYGFYY